MAMPERQLSEVRGQVAAAPGLTPAQVELVKKTVAKGATDDELQMFLHLANKYNLDPFAKEIWFIKRVKKVQGKDGKWDYPRLANGDVDYSEADAPVIMTSRDGYLKIAQNSPEYEGLIGFPVREGDTFDIDAEKYTVTHKFGTKRGKIIGAWAKCDRAGFKPQIAFVDFEEYNDDKSTTWKKYPSAMIQKVAETFVLKRQFSVSGLVSQEEMNSAYSVENTAAIEHQEVPKLQELPQQVGDYVVSIKGKQTKLSEMTKDQLQWLADNAQHETTKAMAAAYLDEMAYNEPKTPAPAQPAAAVAEPDGGDLF
ncbi:Recombinational DNA repair protein RecT [uncultured Sporomusa sp.]|uniref:Recombinational DNA repair protein RecT n=1 Tax=uncultured Sporomusa sp. TaxID=307249 RepID=A0A212LXU2_9FIRM|nr:RecT family recombinase [uncultured Sporomusa sp.]SCM82385.1 Recombinational DNA repair protein RecT [uncultured Sporomusa sp.]